MKNESGMTLVEITVATIVLSIVVLAAGTVYVSAMKEMQRVTDDAHAQIEASLALDHIYANLMGATDIQITNLPVTAITVALGPGGTNPKIRYVYSVATKKILFYPNFDTNPSAYETIANYITALSFTRPLQTVTAQNLEPINNYVTIDITARKGRMQKTFSTGVVLRGMEPQG